MVGAVLRLVPVAVGIVLLITPLAGAYETAPVADGGTIEGRVSFTGPVPPTRKVVPKKDPEVCGGEREVPQMVVASDKGVQEAVVYLKKVERGKSWEKPAAPPSLTNEKCAFRPYVQAVPLGDIEIVNSDPVLHNTHGFLGKLTVFNLALPNQGQRIKRALRKPGVVRVECDAHDWMLAWVYVADNPYYAITAKDGGFTIKDVPPGSYTLVTWHPYTGEVERPVTVQAKDSVTVNIDLKK